MAEPMKDFHDVKTFVSPTGWFITTSLSLRKGEKVIKKSVDFTNLNDLPADIKKGIESGELTIQRS